MALKKSFWKSLREPEWWQATILYLLTAGAIACDIFVILSEKTEESGFAWLACSLYLISALLFVYAVYTFVYFIFRLKSKVKERAKRNAFFGALIENYAFRTFIFSTGSFVVNVGYAIFEGVLAFYSRSVWLAALAVYYGMLAFIRGGILVGIRKGNKRYGKDELSLEIHRIKMCRTSGILMLLLVFLPLGSLVKMMREGQGTIYSGEAIYASAAWAFYKITMAIVNLVKAKKTGRLDCRGNTLY